MFQKDRTGGNGIFIPVQRRSESTAIRHWIVAARSSAIVLEREGEVTRAAQLRARADELEALESSPGSSPGSSRETRDPGELLPVRVRRPDAPR